MKKIMGCILLLCLFLVGCQSKEELQTSKEEPKHIIKKQYPVDTGKQDLNSVDYRVKLNAVGESLGTYNQLFADYGIQMGNEEWMKKATTALTSIQTTSNDLLAIDTSSKYNEVHHILKESLPGVIEAIPVLQSAVTNNDEAELIVGKNMMTKAMSKYAQIMPFIHVFDDQKHPSEGNDKIPYDPKSDPKNYNENGEYRYIEEK